MNYVEYLQEVNAVSIILRIVMAVALGGLIGLQRNITNHPAGFRTYSLVCLGATLAMLTNQYMCDVLGYNGDIARLGAQVITGVGFLGVGTILVTGRQKVKGLTTAAGLWASACLGIAIGIGFYLGAIVGAITIFISLSAFENVERKLNMNSKRLNVYLEVDNLRTFKNVFAKLDELECSVNETDLNSKEALTPGGIGFVLSIKAKSREDKSTVFTSLEDLDGVIFIDEL